MSGTARHFVREQATSTVEEYAVRVYRLAFIYSGIVVAATTAVVLILVKGKFFVTLTQRTNVETLTLALIVVLFAYLAIVSAPGAFGALKIIWYNAPRWFGADPIEVERRKQAALTPDLGQPDSVYLNCLVLRQSAPQDPLDIPLQDEAGSLGTIRIVDARMTHDAGAKHSSNSVLAYFEQRIQALVRLRDPWADVQIVQWATIDDERALQYASVVAFSRNLERRLGARPLWPAVELTDEDFATLTRDGRRLCPALRNEAHLPDLEYEVEHRLPLIPEPLALISLSRQEQRADPVASMGCAFLITLIILGFVLLFIFVPPWVPSK